jgi:molecular chaperone HscB
VNKAFNIFKDPGKTIEYFLKQKGVLVENEKYNLPPAFLMEMMEMNESLEGKDDAEMQQEVAAYENNLQAEVESILMPDAEISEDDLQKLKLYYYKKKYLDRILDRLDD